MKKKIIYIDMDDVLCDFSEAYKMALDGNPGIKFPQSQYGFFRALSPKTGAIEAMELIQKSGLYEPYILTAPSLKNPLSYTEKRVWVEEYLGFAMVRKLIISPDKSLLKGDFLIDDMQTGKGQDKFEGKLLHFGGDVFRNWTDILRFFKLVT